MNLSGDTQSCLRDYAQRHNVTEGLTNLAEFCEVTAATVLDWIMRETLPKGLTLGKLRCFLALHEYNVTEVKSLPGPSRKFLQLMAFDVITMEKAVKELEYADPQAVYRLILLGTGLTTVKAYKLQKLVDQYESERESAEQALLSKFSAGTPVEVTEVQEEHRAAPEVSQPATVETIIQELPDPLALRLLEQHLQSAALLVEHLSRESVPWTHSQFIPSVVALGESRIQLLSDTLEVALDQLD